MTISGFVEYVKQIWKNKPDRTTPITAATLTHMEDGIKGNSDAINEIAQAVVDDIVNDPQKIASMASLYAVNESVKKNASDIKDVNNNLSNTAKIAPASIKNAIIARGDASNRFFDLGVTLSDGTIAYLNVDKDTARAKIGRAHV